jgi:RNA polymerase sigma-70 factor (ECF subfamily)
MTPEDRFEVFFKEHYAELCIGVNRLLRNASLSEDTVQEVFLKVWEKRHRLDFNDRFKFYLKKACYHEALQHLKTQNLIVNEQSEEDSISAEGNSDEDLLVQELEQTVIQGLNTLPDRSRLVFTLARYEDMTYRQIADELNISVKAVEKHMSKALKFFRHHLREFLTATLFYFFS